MTRHGTVAPSFISSSSISSSRVLPHCVLCLKPQSRHVIGSEVVAAYLPILAETEQRNHPAADVFVSSTFTLSVQTPETTNVLLFDLKSLLVICPVEMRCAERVRKRDESEGITSKHCKTIMFKTASIASFQCEVDKEEANLTEEVVMRLF